MIDMAISRELGRLSKLAAATLGPGWSIETDCGPCMRLVKRGRKRYEYLAKGAWVYPEDVGLPRYCGDFEAALAVVFPKALSSVVNMLAGVRRLNPYQLHAFARRWEGLVLWDYHPREHAVQLAEYLISVTHGNEGDGRAIYDAMTALEAAGVDCPVYQATWEDERRRCRR